MTSSLDVSVTEEEFVARRGVGKVQWFVRVNDGWVRSLRHATARNVRLDVGSGRVYATRVELELERGCRLMRVTARPRAVRRTVLECMQLGPTADALVRRDYFAVGRRGDLVWLSRGIAVPHVQQKERSGCHGESQTGERDRRAAAHAQRER